MLMSHSVRPARVYVEWTMRIATGRRLTPVTPVLGAAERLRGQLHGPRRRPARQHGPPLRDLARAGRRAHRGRRRPPARRGAGPHREGPALPPRAARRPTALRAARRPGLRGAPGPPRARADRDPVLPLADRDPGPPGPAPADHRAATTASTRARGSCRSSTSTSRRRGARAGARCAPLPRDRRELLPRRDGRTDPPYEPVPFNVMDDQGVVEPVEHLPGAPTPLGTRGTVDLVGEPLRPREGRAPGRRRPALALPRPRGPQRPLRRRARRRGLADAPQRDDLGALPPARDLPALLPPAPDHDAPGGPRRLSDR